MDRMEDIIQHCGGVDGLAGLFFEAAETERKMPAVIRKRYRSAWPEYAADPGLAYGYNDVEVRVRAASPGETTRWDVALKLGLRMKEDDRRLVWAVAHSAAGRQRGPAWQAVAKIMRCHPVTVKRRFERAILDLWYNMLYGC
ncbi:MAG: DUF6362 family protein [Pseudomonadales bacterium]